MIWQTPVIEDISCGMEVTAYAPATEAVASAGDKPELPLAQARN